MAKFPPRRRAPLPDWTRPITDRLTPSIKWLVISNVMIFFFYIFVRNSRPFILLHLALGPGLFRGEIWQPLTSLFIHVNALFFVNIVGLWFVGAIVEGATGTRRFWRLYLGSGILTNVVMAIASHLMMNFAMTIREDGCAYAVLTMFVAQGRIFGRTQMRVIGNLFLQARTIAILFSGWALLMNAAQKDWPGTIGVIVTILVGFFGASPGGLTLIRSWFADARDRAKVRSLRRRFGVIDGGDRPSKKFVN